MCARFKDECQLICDLSDGKGNVEGGGRRTEASTILRMIFAFGHDLSIVPQPVLPALRRAVTYVVLAERRVKFKTSFARWVRNDANTIAGRQNKRRAVSARFTVALELLALK